MPAIKHEAFDLRRWLSQHRHIFYRLWLLSLYVLILAAVIQAAGWDEAEIGRFVDRLIHFGGMPLALVFATVVAREASRTIRFRRTSEANTDHVSPMGGIALERDSSVRGMIDGWGMVAWVNANRQAGESLTQAVERLSPLWAAAEKEVHSLSMDQRCRHEAAHAVVADAVGRTVVAAHVEDGSRLLADGGELMTGGGVCSVRPIPSQGEGQAAWTSLVTDMAGMVQDQTDGRCSVGAISDILKAERDAAAVISSGWHTEGLSGPLSIGVLVEHARQHATKILTEHADKVDALADALREQRSLDGAQVREVLRPQN